MKKPLFCCLILAITLLVSSGCVDQVNAPSDTTSTEQQPTTTTDPGTDDTDDSDETTDTTTTETGCYASGVGSSALPDYYKLAGIVVKDVDETPVIWSSRWLSSAQQSFFYSDGRLKIRIVAKENPSTTSSALNFLNDLHVFQTAPTADEAKCTYSSKYTKLKLRVGVRSLRADETQPINVQTDYLATADTEILAVDSCSPAIELPVPANSPGNPFVVEIIDVKSDLRCKWAYNEAQKEKYCEVYTADHHDCVQFDVQMSTSYTRDFP